MSTSEDIKQKYSINDIPLTTSESNEDEAQGTVEPLNNTEKGSQLKKGLKERHIQLIALCGMIGTGLFLSTGSIYARSGPVGSLLSFIVMGIITLGVGYCSAETSALYPSSGAFIRHATKYIDPAVGAATGWNFWYCMAISLPAEISAAATVVQYWTDLDVGIFISIFIVFVLFINFCPVRLYGDSEIVFGTLKVLLVLGLIITGIVVTCGGGPNHKTIGFQYWRNPGPFNAYIMTGTSGNFLAWWSTLIKAAYSFGNIQVVFIASSETIDARYQIPKANKKLIFRILFFYIATMFMIGLLLSSKDSKLTNSSGNASASPFVIAFQDAGIEVLPSIVNAVVMTSAISSGSACLFIASRTLYGMALDGQAPKFILNCNRYGVPHWAVGISAILSPIVYLSESSGAATVFNWLVNLSTLAGLIGWIIVCATSLRLYYAMKVQGVSRNDLIYKTPFQPYTSWFCMIFVCLICLFSGFDVFVKGNFTASSFIQDYVNILIFFVLWVIFKILFKCSTPSLEQIDLSNFDDVLNERDYIMELKSKDRSQPIWRRILEYVI